MRKCFFVMLLFLLFVGAGMAETINVPKDKTLEQAMEIINNPKSTEKEFVINITESFNTNTVMDFERDVTTTILGNGKTITVGTDGHGTLTPHDDYLDSFIVVWNGTVNLGKKNPEGNENVLTIKQADGTTGTDSSSCIQIIANTIKGDGSRNPELNMYKDVTISNWKTDNSYGAAVRLYSDILNKNSTATFNMHGGTINGCGFTSGGDQFGGGVAVMHNGVFNMEGGTISNCSASSGGGVCLTYTDDVAASLLIDQNIQVKEPVFTMKDGTISGNFALGTGGGVNVYNGSFVLSGGEIIANHSTSRGGGVCVSGDAYIDIKWQKNYYNNNGKYYNLSDGTFEMNGGEITHNYSNSFGGGIGSQYLGPVKMSGGILCNNKAEQRGDDLAAVKYVFDVSLPSATAMDQKYETFQREGQTNTWSKTRFKIDGWYLDGDDKDELPRWNYEQAFEGASGTNVILGDTVLSDNSNRNIYAKAAFTAYDQIDITKTWKDKSNLTGKRPESLTFTLTDASGDPVKLRKYEYDETTRTGKWTDSGDDAKITLTASDADSTGNVWTGTIAPLLVGPYNTDNYRLKEDDTGDLYKLKDGDPTITFTADTLSDGTSASSGKYTAQFTNIGRVPVTIHKIWDDANNLDQKRPNVLSVDLRMNGVRLNDLDNQEAFYTLTANDGWQKKVYLPVADYTNLTASEGTIADYTLSSKAINRNDDGSFSVVMINKHTLAPAATDTIRNDNMVEIHYQAEKKWEGNNPVGDKKLPQPEVTVILYKDGVETARKVIAANADPATATFSNVPKYRDNDGNEPIAYTIKEEITDPGWVKVGDNLWYSLDGMGKYEGRITDVTVADVGNTEKLTTLTGGTATNTYSTLQTTTTVSVTKLWKDHQNENGVRPKYLKVGLFKDISDPEPVAYITLTGPMKGDAWTGTFPGLNIYDDNGNIIDYSTYVIKEAYPKTYYSDGNPASWDEWVKHGGFQDITDDNNNTFRYDYSTIPNP